MTDSPTSAPAAGMASMFSNAQGVNINGGSFSVTSNFNTGNGRSLKVLHKRVAPNAIVNAGGRADEVRCHPGTREEVIDHIEKWGDGQDGQTEPIFWLSGPAGAGKSAIVQTIAERRKEHRAPCASFFFFRGDTTRSHASPLVATLVYQIISLYPPIRDLITALLHAGPLILDSSLDNQLEKLIVEPLHSMQQSSSERSLLVLVDGLDECDSETKLSQQRILHAFDKVLAQYGKACPFRLLVASRPESQIQMGFNKATSQCLRLFLDEKYSPRKDIQVFVNAKFEEVRRTHPLANMLDSNWPSLADVDYIIGRSSGQFIFGATVMRFILDSSASPAISLDRVKGAARLATKSPFSHLDAVYIYILSQVDDQQLLKDILHAQLLSHQTAHYNLHKFLELYNPNYSKATVVSCVADLTPIAYYEQFTGALEFYHASFADFLSDQSRSGAYFVDLVAFNKVTVPILWKYDHVQDVEAELHIFYFIAVKGTLLLETHLPDLLSIVVSSKGWPHPGVCAIHHDIFVKFYKLCVTDDDFTNFRHIFHQWIIEYQIDYNYPHYRTIQPIPFTDRFIEMGRAEKNWDAGPDCHACLRPETDIDRYELALWLKNLLTLICQQWYYPGVPEVIIKYKGLLRAWINWIIAHDIPLDCPSNNTLNSTSKDVREIQSIDLPYSDRYFAMARTQYNRRPDSRTTTMLHLETDSGDTELIQWFEGILGEIFLNVYYHDAKHYKELLRTWVYWAVSNSIHIADPYYNEITAALRPESDADREEIAAWVNDLLEQIYSKIYHYYSEDCKRLRKKWISWALQNNIPCQNHRYLAMASVDHRKPPDNQMAPALCSETDSDLQELGMWFRELLREIHSEIYSHNVERYKQLLRAWIYWGVSHGIPMDGLRVVLNKRRRLRPSIPMPYSDWYLTMARAERLQPPDKKITKVLRPKTDADLVELGMWFRSVLDEIYSNVHPSNAERYEELMKAWISWAVWNNIPCQNLESLPGAELYIQRQGLKLGRNR